MEIEFGGLQNIGCTEKDLRDFGSNIKDEGKEFNVELLIKFFSSKKEKKILFILRMKLMKIAYFYDILR